MAYLGVFQCRRPEKLTKKGLWRIRTPGFRQGKETRLQAKAHLCTSAIQALFLAYRLLLQLNFITVCSRGCGKANIQTNIQTYKYKHHRYTDKYPEMESSGFSCRINATGSNNTYIPNFHTDYHLNCCNHFLTPTQLK